MMHYIKRCGHCKQEYTYQASGNGCHNPLNDDYYCPECKEIILKALSDVPIKFKCITVLQTDVTLEQCKSWERIEELVRNSETGLGSLHMVRVFAGLADMKTGESQVIRQVKGQNQHRHKTFIYSYWPSKPEEAEVRVYMEENVMTGEKRICDEFHHFNDSDRYNDYKNYTK